MDPQQQQQLLLLAEAAAGLPDARQGPAVQQQQQQQQQRQHSKFALLVEAVLAAAKTPQNGNNTQLLLQLVDLLSTAVALQQQQQTPSSVLTPGEVDIMYAAVEAVAKQQLLQQQVLQQQLQHQHGHTLVQEQQQQLRPGVKGLAQREQQQQVLQLQRLQHLSEGVESPCSTAAFTASLAATAANQGTALPASPAAPEAAATTQQQQYKPLPIRTFLEDVYKGPLLPRHTVTALAFGSSSESDSEERKQKKRKKERRVNAAAADALWHPHFHPHNQEFRVRYRYKGSMRLKTLSCARFGREGAKLLTGAFVARWEATGRKVAERTSRSRLALADLPEDTAQLPSYARKRTDSSRHHAVHRQQQQLLLQQQQELQEHEQQQLALPQNHLLQQNPPGVPQLFVGSLESGCNDGAAAAGDNSSGVRFPRTQGPPSLKGPPRGGVADSRGMPSCTLDDLSGPSSASVLTPSCSSVSAKSPASPEQCSREGLDTMWIGGGGPGAPGAIPGGTLAGSPSNLTDESARTLLAQKRPKPLVSLSKELNGSPAAAAPAASGSNKQASTAAPSDPKTNNSGLIDLGLNTDILQSLLGLGAPHGGPLNQDGQPLGAPEGSKAASQAGATWALLAPVPPVTPTTSSTRGRTQDGVENDLLLQKQQKLERAALLPLDLLQQLGQGVSLAEETEQRQQQQQQEQGALKLLEAAAAAKLRRPCSSEELTRMLKETPAKQGVVAFNKVRSPAPAEDSSLPQETEKGGLHRVVSVVGMRSAATAAASGKSAADSLPLGGSFAADLIGELLFKAQKSRAADEAVPSSGGAGKFVSFGRL
ncbi:Transcription factor with AP2 domain(S), related [Eimeria tenella]|uniref:Transcription factor with AP2 domain(S), related n=1 Tax=Eimeria tenella TaxID=5802 RepID=U6KNX2_EIMTE|nr:Transcription factor with AP2 domain(S), related [Eimeria tenella]CDJ37153.1 Transcription factor with AP2 domain(S), related [Eimeria tenella]|eukprot:XP_013227991.1 Transcription factor with AP2 domain(S), related [Eimeria tenella]